MIGKTVAARVDKLFDKNSFTPFNPDQNNGFVTGCGKVNGCEVMASFIEPDEASASSLKVLQDHLALLERALERKLPVVFIMDTPAMHQSADKSPFPQDPIRLLAGKNGVGRMYSTHARLSGKVPQIVVVLSRLGAALTFPVTLCEAAVMLESAGMSVGRPDVVGKITDKPVDYAALGGAAMHYSTSGSIDHVAADETAAFDWVKRYLGCLTPRQTENYLPPLLDATALEKLVPASPLMGFNTLKLIKGIADGGELVELRAGFARELITCLVRIEGRLTGIVANNSSARGGLFFPESCKKSARFVSICDSFGIPLVFLADNAGFMVGPEVEQAGVIKEASLLFSTIANAAVPRLSVALRRDYTAGVYAMAGPGFDPESFIALPGAVISIYGKGVAGKLSDRGFDEKEKNSLQEMMSGAEDPHKLLEMGLLDEVIEIGTLRTAIADFLNKVILKTVASAKPILLI